MGLARKAITGVFWSNASSYYRAAISFFGGIYLARKIDPQFFGQCGLAASIISLVWVAVMFGQPYAIIRYDGDIKRYISVHVTIRILMVCVIGVALLLVSLFDLFPQHKELTFFILCLFASQAPAQITAIYSVYMQRELMFGRLAVINAISITGAVGLACSLAFMEFKVWSLLWLIMAENFIKFVSTYALSPCRFRPRWDRTMVIEFFHFGKHIFAVNLMRRVHASIDDISIGSLVGNTALGFYHRAYGLCGLLHQVVTGGVMTVSVPVFGKMQGDRERLGRTFELTGSLLLRIAIGGYVWMALVLSDLIAFIYGEKWLPAVPLFRLMLPYALLQSFNVILRNAHCVVGKPSVVSRIKGVELGILLLLLYPLLFWRQAAGAAIAVDVSAIIGTGLFLYYFRPLAEFSIRRLFMNPLLAALIGFAIVCLVGNRLSVSGKLSQLALHTSVFWIVFVGALLLLEFGFWKQTYVRIRHAMIS